MSHISSQAQDLLWVLPGGEAAEGPSKDLVRSQTLKKVVRGVGDQVAFGQTQ